MKVIYDDIIYSFNGDLNCLLFSNLIEEGIEEIELTLYRDIFIKILNGNLNFNEENDYITLYQGLSYFGSVKEQELVQYLYDKIYNREQKELQKEIIDFFEKHIALIKSTICLNTSLPLEFFIKNVSIDWYFLCQNKNIPYSFFEDNINKVNWQGICENPNVNLPFLEKHFEHIDWPALCENSNVPFSFLEKHSTHINWKYISKHTKIPIEFFEKHVDKLHWFFLCKNESIPCTFFEKYMDDIYWPFLCENKSIPFEFFVKHVDKIGWKKLSSIKSITTEFILQNKNKIDWRCLSYNTNIPCSFLNEHSPLLCEYLEMKKYTVKQLENDDYTNLEKIYFEEKDWIFLSKNRTVPISEFEKHIAYVDWPQLSQNDFDIENKIKNKIKNTVYFDFNPLQTKIISLLK